ncbi:MauE/DoxX family redox-associated membrane protein [Lederbergia sp. NSJ-179]|uniref:MauE/DoxX family redox-associated membrane protein n=1 Tax=Lederbergia sp. NSJ-179 TaxID=2931402 RepID=UPI0037BF0765
MINVFIIILILCMYICLIFLKSSLVKLKNPYGFMVVIEQYNIFPKFMLRTITPIIIVFELCIGLWIVVPFLRPFGAIIGIIMQTLFLILLIKNFGRTLERGCGCFEINTPKKITMKHILFNTKLVVILLTILIYEWGK